MHMRAKDQHCVEATVKSGLMIAIESKITVQVTAEVNGYVEAKGGVTLNATVFRGKGCTDTINLKVW